MDYLKNSDNFESLFDFNKEKDNSYEKYEKYLNIYYSIPSKKDIYGREYIDGKMILYDKKDPKKKITIDSPKSVNLFYLNDHLKLQTDIILETISTIIEKPNNITKNDYEKFEELKEKYSLYSTKLQEIDTIHKEHYETIHDLIINKIKATISMGQLYIERESIFKEIKNPIPKESKKEIIVLFKNENNKIPSDNSINRLSKKLNIPSDETHKWLNWILKCYEYLQTRKTLYELRNNINNLNDIFEFKNEYFMIKKPTIEFIK